MFVSTVVKALSILDLFSAAEPELGLTEIARRAGFDKATTRRHLVALATTGLIEQDEVSKLYMLGGAVTRLARVREANFPFLRTALPIVRELAAQTQETVHLSEFTGGVLATVHVEHPQRANRVIVDIGSRLPLHSTASGLAVLSFADERLRTTVLSQPLERFTPHTETKADAIRQRIAETLARGYSINEQGFEEGVLSVAAPIVDAEGVPVGSLAVAAPLIRSQGATVAARGQAVADAARAISAGLNGEKPTREHAKVRSNA